MAWLLRASGAPVLGRLRGCFVLLRAVLRHRGVSAACLLRTLFNMPAQPSLPPRRYGDASWPANIRSMAEATVLGDVVESTVSELPVSWRLSLTLTLTLSLSLSLSLCLTLTLTLTLSPTLTRARRRCTSCYSAWRS